MSKKWSLLIFLCAIFVLYTIDRALLGLLAVPIQNETGISNVRFGVLSAAIFWTYSICVPFSGVAGDRFNRARFIGIAAVTWSVMTFLAGFATGFWSLFFLVSVAIVGPQTMYGPSANALLAEYHTKTRTMALSCHQAAFYTGWFVSGAAVSAILACLGSWRWAFRIFGLVGFVIGLAFLLRSSAYTMPAAVAKKGPSLKTSLKAFFGCKTAMLISVCYVTEVFVSYAYCTWGTKFVAQKFNIPSSQAGTGVMFYLYAASFVAILIAGWLTDRYVGRYPRFRLALSTGALALTLPALYLFGMGSSLPQVWVGSALLGAMLGVIGANQFTALFDVVPSDCRSGAIGFLNVIAGFVGSLSPIILGSLSQTYGLKGFEMGFAAMAVVQVIPIVALLMAVFVTFRHDLIITSNLERK